MPGEDADALFGFYKQLLQLKKQHPALGAGDPSIETHRIKTSADDKVFCFLRKKESREVLVVLNLSAAADLHFDLLDNRVMGTYRNAFSGAANDFSATHGFEMQPWEFLVYEK